MFPEPLEPLPALTVEVPSRQARLSRVRAGIEVLVCSGYPTQLVVIALLASAGILPNPDGTLTPLFIFALSGIDTVCLVGLVWWFLQQSGDSPREVFLGGRSATAELAMGALSVPAIFVMVALTQAAIGIVAPYLHNVPISPFAPLMRSPWLLAGFIVLVLVAGGLREEIQRAFLLHRFDRHLGGRWVGLATTSAVFGLGHTLQGWDAAIITALLGACWGLLYLTRRNIVATVTSHALFNVVQVIVGYSVLQQT
jgi:membrane protease YdiL (CAAX protease family)